ncbi:MAG: hypothetical protein ABR581_02995 [Thermoleophilaceae bacterium]
MQALPVRGPKVRELGLPLPPGRMPLLLGGRPLKRWRWVGVFSPELTLCAGDARVGPFAQRWWALAGPDGTLRTRTTASGEDVELSPGHMRVRSGAVRIELELEETRGIEVVSPSGRRWIWTRKQGDVRARGVVAVDGNERRLDCRAVIDDSAGYHERHTSWRWSCGVGRDGGGRRLAWNLVAGIHDGRDASERTVWLDGEPREIGPVEFADDLSRVAGLRFDEWCAREERTNRLLFRSRYRQPFGTFRGELPGGIPIAEGLGVMEEHDVRW